MYNSGIVIVRGGDGIDHPELFIFLMFNTSTNDWLADIDGSLVDTMSS